MNYEETINSIVSGAIGGGAIVGLASFVLRNWWLERLKSSYAIELETYKSGLNAELKDVQSVLDHKIFVSKAHYETEFESMKTIFGCATKASFLIHGLRPMVGYEESDQTEERKLQHLNSKVNGLAAIHDEFILLSESLMPFYPENLRTALNECAIAIRTEIGDIRTYGLFYSLLPTGYFRAEKNQDVFQKNYHLAANIIRERVERLTILH
jgi:hypothetical protein